MALVKEVALLIVQVVVGVAVAGLVFAVLVPSAPDCFGPKSALVVMLVCVAAVIVVWQRLRRRQPPPL